MRAVVCVAVLAVVCLAEEMTPSQTEMSFTSFATSIPQVVAQEQLNRKFADVMLGLHISSQFYQFGSIEYQKFQKLGKAETDTDLEGDEVKSVVADEDDDDDVSLLELKDEFVPMGGSLTGAGLLGMSMMTGYGTPGLGVQPVKSGQTVDELELAGSQAKISALKAMQIQFYLAASDVEKSYWTNKILNLLLPPQFTVYKLYKSYLNTMALSVAFQLHDSFTLEAYLDDFNDRLDAHHGSALSEIVAEQTLYTQWYSLAMIKWQLFMINLYEKMSTQQVAPQMQAAQTQAYGAASYLEVDAEPFVAGQNPNAFAMQYAYLSYYTMMLKYTSLFSEIQLAQNGLMTANTKLQVVKDSDEKAAKQALYLEGTVLPSAFVQWSSINHQRFTIEYYLLVLDMYAPGIAATQAADRAENTFQNLVQTEQPVTKAA
eukprot:c1152_g1_i1.p1 GENE.c1152_g1_i1~~c1152_g1_i1.p1  ORF type:complete len:449 (+),score=102.65 c1152_g1_i1:59-1348(+)